MSTCIHCERDISRDQDGRWIDPEATGDDSVWRETCDSHDTFVADHEPMPEHVNYPHYPGALYDCVACESACHCSAGSTECVFDGEHNGSADVTA